MATRAERRQRRKEQGICRNCPAFAGDKSMCPQCSARRAEQRRARKRRGLCRDCGNPSPDRDRCKACYAAVKEQRTLRYLAGTCRWCDRPRKSSSVLCMECRAKITAKKPRERKEGHCGHCERRIQPLYGTLCETCYFKDASYRNLGSIARWQALKAKFEEQGGRCDYTGIPLQLGVNASVDHRTPRSRGGKDEIDNLHWVDLTCNACKGALNDSEFLALVEAIYKTCIARS